MDHGTLGLFFLVLAGVLLTLHWWSRRPGSATIRADRGGVVSHGNSGVINTGTVRGGIQLGGSTPKPPIWKRRLDIASALSGIISLALTLWRTLWRGQP